MAVATTKAKAKAASKCESLRSCGVVMGKNGDGFFPSFLPEQVRNVKDPFARTLARRIERLPVQVCISFLLGFVKIKNFCFQNNVNGGVFCNVKNIVIFSVVVEVHFFGFVWEPGKCFGYVA